MADLADFATLSRMGSIDENLNSLHAERKALQEEWRLAESDPILKRQKTRDGIADLGPSALVTLARIIQSGSSESLQLKASQFVIQSILGDKDAADAESSLNSLVERLTPKPLSQSPHGE